MESLARLKGLSTLSLMRSSITDEGLKKGLRSVMLHNTSVTDEGIKDLREALPDLRHVYK